MGVKPGNEKGNVSVLYKLFFYQIMNIFTPKKKELEGDSQRMTSREFIAHIIYKITRLESHLI